MTSNGLRPFSFHRHDRPQVAVALRPTLGIEAGRPQEGAALGALDPESAARRYLAQAFASEALPTFESVALAGRENEFRTLGTEALPLTGTTTVKFRQMFQQIPVYGSLVTVELDSRNELVAISSALGQPTGVSAMASLSPAQAMEVVARTCGRTEAGTEIVPRLNFYFEPRAQQWHLAYLAENVRCQPEGGGRSPVLFDYVIDAHSGEVLAQLPRTQSVGPQVGPGPVPYAPPPPPLGEQKAREAPVPPSPQPAVEEGVLDELGRQRRFGFKTDGARKLLVDEALHVHTYDFAFRDLLQEDRALPGGYVTLPPEPWARAGVSAHANAIEVATFLRDVLKREGLDNRGGPLVSSVNCLYGGETDGREWRNAAWIGTQMVYGQRKAGEKLISYSAALDVVAHEILHGLTDHSARLQYAGMSGALNESYSDIFGIIVSNLHEPDVERWNWQMGEELSDSGVPIRDLRTPGKYRQPEHMRDYRQLPVDAWNDWGGVHTNSGIHNKAAYNLLTARGADGAPLLNPREVAALFYLALTQHLSRTSGFAESRRGVELAARTLFRDDPRLDARLEAVARAFSDVGIGEQPTPIQAAEASGVAAIAELEAAVSFASLSVAPPFTAPYDPDFLGDGFRVPLPDLDTRARQDALEEGRVFDYIHYSLVMNARRRTALYTACNIDGAHGVRLGRQGLPWMLDPRLPADAQLGPEYYRNNAWDRGHLVRREDPIWGPVRIAREANAATFYYSNAAPQHENFNQDEWLVLEDWVLEHATDGAYRLCVFTGPVLRSDDPPLRDAQIPAGFWKIVAVRDATADGEDLSVVAFFMKQTEMSGDRLGGQLLKLKRYQITLGAIERWTGLDFGALSGADELAWTLAPLQGVAPREVSAFRAIESPADIVFAGSKRRASGGRILPVSALPAADGARRAPLMH